MATIDWGWFTSLLSMLLRALWEWYYYGKMIWMRDDRRALTILGRQERIFIRLITSFSRKCYQHTPAASKASHAAAASARQPSRRKVIAIYVNRHADACRRQQAIQLRQNGAPARRARWHEFSLMGEDARCDARQNLIDIAAPSYATTRAYCRCVRRIAAASTALFCRYARRAPLLARQDACRRRRALAHNVGGFNTWRFSRAHYFLATIFICDYDAILILWLRPSMDWAWCESFFRIRSLSRLLCHTTHIYLYTPTLYFWLSATSRKSAIRFLCDWHFI